LEYLKVRKLSVKTARRKPTKPDFGIFCEATWFRKQLHHRVRDLPVPLRETESAIHHGVNGHKRKRRGSHMQDRAAQFVYAHIPTPEDLPPLPSAPPIDIDSCNNYDDIYKQYEEYVKNSHRKCSTKDDFHWEQYLTEKLIKIPNKFRNVEDILGIKKPVLRTIKAQINDVEEDEEYKMGPLLQVKILCEDD
jgi:hypothetical protein